MQAIEPKDKEWDQLAASTFVQTVPGSTALKAPGGHTVDLSKGVPIWLRIAFKKLDLLVFEHMQTGLAVTRNENLYEPATTTHPPALLQTNVPFVY